MLFDKLMILLSNKYIVKSFSCIGATIGLIVGCLYVSKFGSSYIIIGIGTIVGDISGAVYAIILKKYVDDKMSLNLERKLVLISAYIFYILFIIGVVKCFIYFDMLLLVCSMLSIIVSALSFVLLKKGY